MHACDLAGYEMEQGQSNLAKGDNARRHSTQLTHSLDRLTVLQASRSLAVLQAMSVENRRSTTS